MKWSEVPTVIKQAFPRLSFHPNKKVFVHEYPCKVGAECNTASYWDNGSISHHALLSNGKWTTPPTGEYPRFVAEYAMKVGDTLVTHRHSHVAESFIIYRCNP